jgi:UDP-N-acetyl-2-amino-2-deoxyglucuronate dehydrogenase
MQKSGGVATNIGVHFFDMLTWIFGPVLENIVHLSDRQRSAGFLRLEKARVRWLLSIDQNDLPVEVSKRNQRTLQVDYH